MVLGLLCLEQALGSDAAAEKIGKVVLAAQSLTAGGRVLTVNADVMGGERVRTSGSGRGEFVFVDGTKFAIGPSASFTLTQGLLRGPSKFKRLGIAAARGSFRWISGNSGSSSYKLTTPTGTIGIRGTAVDITVRGGRAYVALLNGSATVFRGGGCQTLNRACEYVEVGGGVSEKKQINTGFTNRQSAAQVFPYLANPARLSSRFRVSGSGCLSRAEFSKTEVLAPRKARAATPPPPPPPPPNVPKKCPTNCGNGKGNGGTGNGTPDEGQGNN